MVCKICGSNDFEEKNGAFSCKMCGEKINANKIEKISLKDYNAGYNFSCGLAYAERKGCSHNFSFFDTNGVIVFNCIYDHVSAFEFNNCAVVSRVNYSGTNYSGIMNTNGELIVPCEYTYLTYNEGLYCGYLNGDDLCYIDERGNKILDLKGYKQSRGFHEGLAGIQNSDGKWGFIDKNGNIKIDFIFDEISTDGFNGGLVWVSKYEANDRFDELGRLSKYGCIDKEGNVVIPFDYEVYGDFYNGLASVRKKVDDPRNYVINKKGEIVFSDSKLSIGDYKDGFARIYDGNKHGLMDLNGNIVVPCRYFSIDEFSEGLARVWNHSDRSGFINTKGEQVINLKYQCAVSAFHDGLAPVFIDNQWKYINKKEEVIIE